MDKSIENIWEDVMSNDEAFDIPKLKNNQFKKSNHIIEKFKRRFRNNMVIICLVSCLILIVSYYQEVVIEGAILSFLLFFLAWQGTRNLKKLKSIDLTTDSRQYVERFYSWLNELYDYNIRINQFVYPLLYMTFFLGFKRSSTIQDLYSKMELNPDLIFIFGIPIWWVVPFSLGAFFLYLFARPIFKFDMDSIYGPVLRKLESHLDEFRLGK